MTKNLTTNANIIKEENIEGAWSTFKETILDTTQSVCGVPNTNSYRKQTCKKQVKDKKKRNDYISCKTPDRCKEYKKKQRTQVKQMVN